MNPIDRLITRAREASPAIPDPPPPGLAARALRQARAGKAATPPFLRAALAGAACSAVVAAITLLTAPPEVPASLFDFPEEPEAELF